MNAECRYEIESLPHNELQSRLNVRVTLYDRSLKTAIYEFLAAEQLAVQRTTMDDSFIDYEIAGVRERSLSRLEQILYQAR